MRELKYILFLFPLIGMAQLNGVKFETNFESAAEFGNTNGATRWRDDLSNADWTLVGNQREGNSSVRIINDSNLDRNELTRQRVIDWNKEYWLRFSLKVVQSVNGNKIIMQHRNHPSNSQNPITIRTHSATQLQIELATDETYANTQTPATGAGSGTEKWYVDYTIGEWQDFVFHFVLDETNGYMQGWHNGTQFANETGTTTYGLDNNGTPLERESFLKIGTYVGPNTRPAEGEVHYDAFLLWEGTGATYQSIALPRCDDDIQNGSETGVDCGGSCPNSCLQTGVFPGAKGWGADWTFPKNTASYINVTNLNDSGAGSLRQAIADADPLNGTIITFYGLSGYINLTSRITTSTDNLYVAGQTSPNGITLRKSGNGDHALFRVGGSNTIIRDLIGAVGTGASGEVNGDNWQIDSGVSNVIFDKCESYFAVDESVQFYANSSKVTFQNGIVAYSLHNATHNSTVNSPFIGHSKGAIVGNGATNISWYGNFFANNHDRNIAIGGGDAVGQAHEADTFLSYNAFAFGFRAGSPTNNDNVRVNLTNYLDKNGVSTDNLTGRRSIMVNDNGLLYVNSVWNQQRTLASQPQWDAVGTAGSNGATAASTNRQSASAFPYPLANEPILTQSQIENHVLNNSGSSNNWFGMRQKVIDDYNNGTGELIDDPSEVGGYPSAPSNGAGINDTDNDGIPDSEEANFTTLFDYVNSIIDGSTGSGENNIANKKREEILTID